MSSSKIADYFSLTKPRVVVLLQITALCAVIVHDSLEGILSKGSAETMLVVLVGGYLTAGGANAINMWYDRDIDPMMRRTENRAIPSGKISAESALIFGFSISSMGVLWFYFMSNEVAAFWSAFSILFYVLIYSMWLKRSTPQNIVIGGIAGSTPPVIGWAASVEGLSISYSSLGGAIESLFDLGSPMPWFMFILIFLWTPPHFWALSLYRSEEYAKVGVPMLPNVKGPKRTIVEMKVYSILLIILSLFAPLSFGEVGVKEWDYHVLSWTILGLSLWYASTVWRIDISELPDETGRIASAAKSFLVSMLYLALMFVVLVAGSFGQVGTGFGAIISLAFIGRTEFKLSS
jgi:protoheme IX farnesyltransferase